MIELVNFSEKHRDGLVRVLNQQEVIKWIIMPPVPYFYEDADSYIGKCRENLKSDYEFNFAIELNGKYIGGAVLRRIQDDKNNAITGYSIGKEYWGKGYGTEALKKIVRFGFDKLKLQKIIAYIFTGNIASEKILLKCGFKHNAEIIKQVKKGTATYNLKYFSIEA